MNRIAVLVPCHNEERTIAKVVGDFKKALPEAQVYVYDNNSTDKTADIARAAGAIVRSVRMQGKGNVVRRMFHDIDAECYVMVDGDDTYPAESAPEMVSRVLTDRADMVIGDRLSSTYYTENKRRFHNVGNDVVKRSINALFKCDISDILTGYRAFSFMFVKSFPVLSRGFEIETEMSIHAIDKNMQVDTVVVSYRDRPDGSESKLNTLSDGLKVLKTILVLVATYKPLMFYGTISVFLIVLSAVFFVPVLTEYVRTGEVPNFPTLIACGFTAMAALQAFFAGVILETINKKNRQDFEMRLSELGGVQRRMTESDDL